uniref:TPT domain-containing protein n=1 Tax=Steinernema glaseri TaxID=37863 RepID=A0A1I8ATQ4_9BILA
MMTSSITRSIGASSSVTSARTVHTCDGGNRITILLTCTVVLNLKSLVALHGSESCNLPTTLIALNLHSTVTSLTVLLFTKPICHFLKIMAGTYIIYGHVTKGQTLFETNTIILLQRM